MSNKPTSKELKKMIDCIKIIIINIDKKGINVNQREDYFWNNHPDIMNKYPFLVSMLLTNMEHPMLNIMLTQLENIEKGVISQDDADKEIGEKLAEDYLPK
jgi:hypothetical protein